MPTTAKNLQEQVKRTFDDEGCDDIARARIAIEWIVDWLVENEEKEEKAWRNED